MNEEKHFLEAISAGEPNADLIYADWLEEQGRPEADEIRDPVVVFLLEWSRSRSRSLSRSLSRSRFGTRFWSGFGSRTLSFPRSRSRSSHRPSYRSFYRSRSHSRFT